jgi:tetratricopeptide (TPR) repeat protein
MRPALHVTAVLLLVAFGTAACSQSDEESAGKAANSARTKPLAAPATSPAVKSIGADAKALPTLTDSFADGESAYYARKYGEAVAVFERYTERRPGNAWGHYMLGLSAWKSGDPGKAEAAFEKALSIDPRHVKSLVNLSRVVIDQKRHDDAIERLTRAAEIAPESAEVHRLLGRTYGSMGRVDEAEQAYSRALELNELDAWSMNNLGLLLLGQKRPGDALPLLAKAVELRKDVPEFQNNLGMALEHTGRFRAAATAYTAALTADPSYVKAQQNLARVDAVKAGPEEPFEIRTVGQNAGEPVESPVDAKRASN